MLNSGDAPGSELQALDQLFAELIRERISHGDFKGHNLFWDDGALVADRPGMPCANTRSAASFATAYAKDRARFMRNWAAGQRRCIKLIDQRLPKEISIVSQAGPPAERGSLAKAVVSQHWCLWLTPSRASRSHI